MPDSLYIHIPFCGSRCPYCDFAFVVGKMHLSARYARAVRSEMEQRLTDLPRSRFESVFLGGGTPSAVPVDDLRSIFDTVAEYADIAPGAEITAESNPNDHKSFADLRALGITRLSIGAQAMDDATLKSLGRFHNADDIVAAVESARRAGFDNINLDLIFGAPDQSLDHWQGTLEKAIALQPDHLSVYGLTLEEGTNFWRRSLKGRLPLPDEDLQASMYSHTLERLERAGFGQYEVSNFAKPNRASRHNLACWERQPYLGVGLSAHSFVDGVRTWNTRELNVYLERVEAGQSPVDGSEVLTHQEARLEEIMLGLRRPSGVPASLVSSGKADSLLREHLIERESSRLRLTRSGLLLADLVAAELAQDEAA